MTSSHTRMAALHSEVSVVAPIQPAIERAKHLLFRPFQLARWLPIAFCAWLAGLGRSGAGGYRVSVPFPPSPPSGRLGRDVEWHTAVDWHEEQLRDEVMRNLYWIVPMAIVLLCLCVALWLLVLWLSSRGEFMFLHCVALDRAEVAVPWRQHARAARSLFRFRIALGLIASVPMLLLLGVIGLVLVGIFRQRGASGIDVAVLVAAGLALLGVGLAFLAVDKLTKDLVVPIMFLRGSTCPHAWNELLDLFAGRFGAPIVYLLFQIVLSLVIGALVVAAMIVTCCLAACLMILPYIGTVVLLPVLVFQRSYSLYYLRQFGPQYDAFQTAPPPPAPSPALSGQPPTPT